MKRIYTLIISGLLAVTASYSQSGAMDSIYTCPISFDIIVMESFPPQYRFVPSREDSGVYFWDFGDGTWSNEKSPTHTYQYSGTYKVCLSYQSAEGCTSNSCETLTAQGFDNDPPSFCNYTGTVKDYTGLDGCGLLIELDNGIVLEPAEVVPDFALRDGQRVMLGYTELKDRASICMSGVIARIDCIVEIQDSCFVSFYFYELPWVSSVPPIYKFVIDSGYSITEVVWDFGDGTVTNEYSPQHRFQYDGYYNVCLKVAYYNGCTANYCHVSWFDGYDPVPGLCDYYISLRTEFILNGQECNGTATAGLVDISGKPVPVAEYLWSTGETSQQVYNLCPGFTYSVTVVDATGCAVSGSFAYGTPVIYPDSLIGYWNYHQDDMAFVFNLPVYDDSVYCEWDFGDGGTATGSVVNHTYASTENYTVQLKVFDRYGNIILKEQILVSPGSLTRTGQTQSDRPVVYPVPATDIVFIELTGSDGIRSIEIMTTEGRILRVNSTISQSGNKAEINVSGLPAGFYLGRLFVENGESRTFRFVKQ